MFSMFEGRKNKRSNRVNDNENGDNRKNSDDDGKKLKNA